jgi:hypothetical protein
LDGSRHGNGFLSGVRFVDRKCQLGRENDAVRPANAWAIADPRVGGIDNFRGRVGDAAVAPDQIFVKVPARHILWPEVRRPLIERMRIRSLHGLRRSRKGNPILMLRRLRSGSREVA